MKNQAIRWVLIGLIIIAGIYVIADRGRHIASYLPLAFLFGCLFMHLFMHGSHGRHGHQEDHSIHKHGDTKQ